MVEDNSANSLDAKQNLSADDETKSAEEAIEANGSTASEEDDAATDANSGGDASDDDSTAGDLDDDEEECSRIERLADAQNTRETLRDIIRDEIEAGLREAVGKETDDSSVDKDEHTRKRREELLKQLNNLSEVLDGKTAREVAATLAAYLDATSQLSLQTSQGVIVVKCRLATFFLPSDYQGSIPQELHKEISLLFTPEEVEAIRSQMEDAEEDHPMRPFLTAVLDQSFDVMQYNEMTGVLLVEMTKHFLEKLRKNGHDKNATYGELKERHVKTVDSLNRALTNLEEVCLKINQHIKDNPVLEEVPKALRLLIHVRLGLLPSKIVPKLLSVVREKNREYAKVRGLVAFDFSQLDSARHGVQLRISAILNLHSDILAFTAKKFEAEFASAMKEFENLTAEIETATEVLDPNSREYLRKLERKALLQERITKHRNELDVIKSQKSFVELQSKQVQTCLERFEKEDGFTQKLQEITSRKRIETPKQQKEEGETVKKKKVVRMATADFRE